MGSSPGNRETAARQTGRPSAEAEAQFLSALVDALDASASPSDLASPAAKAVVEALGEWCALWLWEGDLHVPRLAGAHHRGRKDLLLQRLVGDWLTSERNGFLRSVIEASSPTLLVMGDKGREAEIFGSRERALLARRTGTGSLLMVPLTDRRQLLGLLVVASAASQAVFSEHETALLQRIAGRLSMALALLQRAQRARLELECQKDEFLAMVAHELKTPLTTLSGYVQFLLRQVGDDPELRVGERELNMLQVAERQVRRLNRLVSSLMEFSAIQMGRLDLQSTSFSLGELATEVVSQMGPVTPDRDMRIDVLGDTVVEADAERVEQLLVNLLSNAIKATETGGRIAVTVREEAGSVVTSVQDSGTGMSEEVQKLVFERLYRGPDRRHEGMGLGLYVSKGIVDAHGGKIWFDSAVGAGTIFYFSLPASKRASAGAIAPGRDEQRP